MSQINMPTSLLRLDTSRSGEYLGVKKPKLSFGQKIGRFFGKALSFLGPIGAAVTAIALPGVGIPIAAGLYGLSKVSSDLTNRAIAKDQLKMQDHQKEMAGKQISLPGFFTQNLSPADIQTDFIAPSQYNSGIQNTLINRESGINNNIHRNF